MSDRVSTQCGQCGQTDDHPKAHIGEVTKHHDCLSFSERQMLIDSVQVKGAPKASAVIDACVGGLRGEKLLKKILSGEMPAATGKAVTER